MINRVSKGRRKEKICYDELKDYPYRWKTIRHKFLNIDFFKEFDIVVCDDTIIRFIQVKTGYCPKEVRERIRNMKILSNVICPLCKTKIDVCTKELWLWFDRKGWRKEIIP